MGGSINPCRSINPCSRNCAESVLGVWVVSIVDRVGERWEGVRLIAIWRWWCGLVGWEIGYFFHKVRLGAVEKGNTILTSVFLGVTHSNRLFVYVYENNR